MMPMAALSLCLVLLLGAFSPAISTTVQDVPNLRNETGSRVSDMADLLSDRDEYRLNQMIYKHEVKSGNEIAIVTVRRVESSTTPKAFATELFNEWGIGRAGEDNGLLFFVSQGDRRVEIEVGYGLEASLSDAEVGRVLRRWVTPEFKQGNFDRGIGKGTKALIADLEGNPIPPWQYDAKLAQSRRNAENRSSFVDRAAPLALPILFIIVIAVICVLFDVGRGRGRSDSSNSNHTYYDYGSSSSSSYSDSASSGSDFSGGSDFGGGSSGGGGAGDSW